MPEKTDDDTELSGFELAVATGETAKAVSRRTGAQRADAEDAAQEAYLRVRGKGEGVHNKKQYVNQTAVNEFNREKRGPVARTTSDEALDTMEAAVQTLDDRLIQQENETQVKEALQKLSPQHRKLIELKFFCGWSDKAIQRELGQTDGGYRILKFRALRALKQELPISLVKWGTPHWASKTK